MTPSTHRPPPPSFSLLSSTTPARPISTRSSHSNIPHHQRSHTHQEREVEHLYRSESQQESSFFPFVSQTTTQSPFRFVMTAAFEGEPLSASSSSLSGPSTWSQRKSLDGAVVKSRPHLVSHTTFEMEASMNEDRRASTSSEIPTSSNRLSSGLIRVPSTLALPLNPPSPFLLGSSSKQKQPMWKRYIPTKENIRPWLPFILYGMSSLGFLLAITLWRSEVFQRLDELSHSLQSLHELGYAIMFLLIFVTTIPPLPLYSTLIILSGYTFGAIQGAVVSYFAALFGALAVFLISRAFFRGYINRCLSHTVSMKRVVRAIEKRPKLLFLIRLAPYPYNMMNALLAGSPTLTLSTYTMCTALSLFKVIIHTSIGSGIHSFASYHDAGKDKDVKTPEDNSEDSQLGRVSKIVGIVLVVAITLYLSYIARKAVNEELGDESGDRVEDGEESQAMLADFSTDNLDQMAERTDSNSNTINSSNLFPSNQTALSVAESAV